MSAARMKVYGWLSFDPKTGAQVRCIMAANSLREMRQACDQFGIWPGRKYLATTGNEEELRQARKRPGRILFAENNYRSDRVYLDWSAEFGEQKR
jgi:hypothetical protein